MKGHGRLERQWVTLLLPVLGAAALTIVAFALWPGWAIFLSSSPTCRSRPLP